MLHFKSKSRLAGLTKTAKIAQGGGFREERTPHLHAAVYAPALTMSIRARVAASAVLRADAAAIALWRKQPIELGGQKLSASFLKNADDQAVLAVRAVLKVIDHECWHERSFADWGVLAAPQLFGRISIASTIERFRAEGAWGVSPHLIPNQSIHAISGTISQALKIHGPNFGVCGGPNSGPDAFLIALAMLSDGALPGLWLVLTGHEREWIPAPGQSETPPTCHGIAMALMPFYSLLSTGGEGRGLSIENVDSTATSFHPDFDLTTFLNEFGSGLGKWRLTNSHLLELDAEPRP